MPLIDTFGCVYDDFLQCECYLIGFIPACVRAGHMTNPVRLCVFVIYLLVVCVRLFWPHIPPLFFCRWSDRKGRWRRGRRVCVRCDLSFTEFITNLMFLTSVTSIDFLLCYCGFFVFARQPSCRPLRDRVPSGF